MSINNNINESSANPALKTLERKIQKQFNKGCVKYGLLEDGDKILVGLSGGKDSLMLLDLLSKRSRIYRPKIKVEALHVIMSNIPYKSDLDYLKKYCAELDVKLNVVETEFDESTDKRKTKCFLCSWNRRKALFSYAESNKFTKVALGHHQDDILTTLLMNMCYEGSISTMSPKLKLEHYDTTIIRPLCLVQESDIKEYAELSGWKKQIKNCPYEDTTMRDKISHVLKELMKQNEEVRHNIWKSVETICKDN